MKDAGEDAGGAWVRCCVVQDPSFVQSVLGSLPGVDPNDPRIQQVLSGMPQNPDEKKEGDKKE